MHELCLVCCERFYWHLILKRWDKTKSFCVRKTAAVPLVLVKNSTVLSAPSPSVHGETDTEFVARFPTLFL